MKITACSVVRNAIIGGIPLFEAMSVILPYVDNMLIVDTNSNDKTYSYLLDIASSNNKLWIESTIINPKYYPDLLSIQLDTIASCKDNYVLYFDPFDIFNDKLLKSMRYHFEQGKDTISFWYGSFSHNFQLPQGFPELRCRAGTRDALNDWFNTITSDSIAGDLASWHKWSLSDYEKYSQDYVFQVQWNSAFIHNTAERRKIDFFIDQHNEIEQWYREETNNSDWLLKETSWTIPNIMKPHLGKSKYEVNPKLIEQLKGE